MKYILSIILIAGLTGCFQAVDNVDLERAIGACEGLEKIYKIQSHLIGTEWVECKNGKQYKLGSKE